jgi:hypothetical protein
MNRSRARVISRRQFAQRCGSIALTPLCARAVTGQSNPGSRQTASSFQATLSRGFKGAQFYGVSPDSSRICLYRFRHLENLLKAWTYDGGNSRKVDDVLQVVELKSGNTVYATQLRSMAVSATFFADSHGLYTETMLMGSAATGRVTTFQQAAINLDTRELAERLAEGNIRYFALTGRAVLGLESNPQTSQSEALVRAELPDYKEVVRVPFAATQEPERYGRPAISGRGIVYGHDTDPLISADRRTVAYGAGHSLVCRTASNLEVLWTRAIEPEYLGAWLLDLTPDGSKVAAAVVGGSSVADRDKFYVGVYDGKDGSVVAKFPINGREGVAISPDGKLLAVSQQTRISNGQVQPSVNIYDVSSGHQVGDVAHPAVNTSGFGNSGVGSIGSKFTPDGKYLITSGVNDTMVWAVKS